MSTGTGEEIKRRTAKRKSPLLAKIIQGKTAIVRRAEPMTCHCRLPGPRTKPFLLRSDNALVFIGPSDTAQVKGYGLRQEFITPHCSQQNGMIERVIRTFNEQFPHCYRLLKAGRFSLEKRFLSELRGENAFGVYRREYISLALYSGSASLSAHSLSKSTVPLSRTNISVPVFSSKTLSIASNTKPADLNSGARE